MIEVKIDKERRWIQSDHGHAASLLDGHLSSGFGFLVP